MPSYAMYFVDKDMGFPKDIVRFNTMRGIKTVLSQELMAYSTGTTSTPWTPSWRAAGTAISAASPRTRGPPRTCIYYRFGYEMNGDWMPWGEQPEKFVKAWKRAWKIFHEEKATNVRWVFSPNVIWDDRTVKRRHRPLLSRRQVRGRGGPGRLQLRRQPLPATTAGAVFDEVFKVSLDGMKRHFPKKPLWITEIGCAEGPGKAEWIADFFTRFNADPDIRVFMWFNEDKQYAGEPNWRFDSDKDSLEKFRMWAIHNNSITTFSLPTMRENARESSFGNLKWLRRALGPGWVPCALPGAEDPALPPLIDTSSSSGRDPLHARVPALAPARHSPTSAAPAGVRSRPGPGHAPVAPGRPPDAHRDPSRAQGRLRHARIRKEDAWRNPAWRE